MHKLFRMYLVMKPPQNPQLQMTDEGDFESEPRYANEGVNHEEESAPDGDGRHVAPANRRLDRRNQSQRR